MQTGNFKKHQKKKFHMQQIKIFLPKGFKIYRISALNMPVGSSGTNEEQCELEVFNNIKYEKRFKIEDQLLCTDIETEVDHLKSTFEYFLQEIRPVVRKLITKERKLCIK